MQTCGVPNDVQLRQVDIELKNYRCFPRNRPARFAIGRRFTGFIGVNNAGKSTLLRIFYELRQPLSLMSQPLTNFHNLLTRGERVNFTGVGDDEELFSNQNDGGLEIRLEVALDEADPEDVPLSEQHLPVPSWLILRIDRESYVMTVEAEGVELKESSGLAWHETVLVVDDAPTAEFGPWMNLFDNLRNSVYIPAFRNAINAGAGTHYDVQIGSGFIAQWDRYKSGSIKADNRAALDLTAEIRRIFGFEELDINASQENDTLQVIIDGRSYRLDEIGGGLAHFIMVLAYVATSRPAFVFIDEPELNLHPSLQLDFLTTIANYSGQGVVFATHSIGLARAAAEVVYSVRRVSSGESEVSELEGTPRLAEFLGELSLSGYQELGFDKVLLVEGSTDVKVFQRLLRLYGIEHKVVLLPLGGSTMIRASAADELVEVKRLTSSVFAIIDSERTAQDEELPPERQAFVEACREAEVLCTVLERRATENYFSDRAVKAVMGPKYRALQPYEALGDVELPWNKNDNWRIAGNMEQDEIAGTDLGDFLDGFAA